MQDQRNLNQAFWDFWRGTNSQANPSMEEGLPGSLAPGAMNPNQQTITEGSLSFPDMLRNAYLRFAQTGNRPFLGMESDLPGSLMTPPPQGGFSPGMGLPEEAPLRPADRQPTPPLPPLQEVIANRQPAPPSVPAYQPPAQPQVAPVAVPGPQAGPAASSTSGGVSGNTLLGLAAITDAFAILGGRQPTMMAQMAPIAQQRSQQQALSQIIAQRMQGNLTPQQATLLGNAVQQAATGAQTQAAPAAGGEVPTLRAAPGQDPNEVRGVRTNNPLNLSFANQPNAIGTDGRFAVFQTPEEGVAASVRQLQLYGQRGLNTIDQIVSRWAPPSENNTAAYIQAVAQRVGVSPNQEIDLSDPNIMRRLVNAMSVQEVGRVIPDDVLRRGVDLGYEPPQQRQKPSLTPAQSQITAPSPAAPSIPPKKTKKAVSLQTSVHGRQSGGGSNHTCLFLFFWGAPISYKNGLQLF
jgi:hypothetical protein